MKDHLSQCPFRVTKCTNSDCDKKIAFKDRQKHDSECRFKLITCRNNCHSEFERRLEDEHFDVCELQMIRCPYYEMGCKTDILRKDNIEHLQMEAFNHSVIFIENQNKKNEEINALKTEMFMMKEEFSSKFDEIFRAMNLKNQEEIKLDVEIDRSPAPAPEDRDNHLEYSSFTSDNQSIEDYKSDEFESDYSFGFRNF